MKQLIRRSFCLAVAVLCYLCTWAGGKVEVADDVSNGTILGSVNGTVVTLTVTPDEGYYIRKTDMTVVKTFMPATARANVPTSDILVIEGDDPEDLSQPRNYTVTLPGEEYDILVHASFTSRNAITEGIVTLSETAFIYSGEVQRPTVTVEGLVEGKDYEVTYSEPSSVEAGIYSLTVKGTSLYTGTVVRNYSIYRGGLVEVNDNIAHGSIVPVVNGLTVTLNVTPADGYYIRKSDIKMEKTYMPQARSEAPLADQLALTGDDPEDLSLPRTYTVTMPGWEFNAWVNATFPERTTLTDAMVKLSASTFVYNGKDQKPTVTLSGLTEGRDYILTFNETEWKDVGSYSLSVTGKSTYKGTVNKTFTITKAQPVVTAPTAQNLTYNEKEQTLLAEGTVSGGEMQYSLTENGTFSTTVPTGKAAGNYVVYYRIVGDSNHKDVAPKPVNVTINPKTVDNPVIELSQSSYVYDEKAKEPTVTVKDGDTEIPATEYEVTYTANTNAGEAKVTITDKEKGNYTVSGHTTFTIGKAAAQVLSAPVARTLNYTAEEQALIEEGTAKGGEMQYSLDGENYSKEVPTAKEVDEYTVWYRVVGDDNHYDVEAQKLSVIISKIKLTLADEDDNTATLSEYSGSIVDLTLTRTWQKGSWNTLAVPFDVDELTMMALAYQVGGALKVKELVSTTFTDETLTLNFADASAINAGKPYLVMGNTDIVNPTFPNVTLSATLTPTETDFVDFIPTLGKTQITGEEKSVLFLAVNNKLIHPATLPADIKGFRAYFQLKGEAAVNARTINIEFVDDSTTGIGTILQDDWKKTNETSFYTLDGRKVQGKPFKKGIYVKSKQRTKVIVR